MWSWFKDQADAEYRSPGAHLRWLIDKYKADTETRLDLIDRFASAVPVQITADQADRARIYGSHPLAGAASHPEGMAGLVHPDPDEGMT